MLNMVKLPINVYKNVPCKSKPRASAHGCIKRSGYSVRGGVLFIPMNVALWCMKPKKPLAENILHVLYGPSGAH